MANVMRVEIQSRYFWIEDEMPNDGTRCEHALIPGLIDALVLQVLEEVGLACETCLQVNGVSGKINIASYIVERAKIKFVIHLESFVARFSSCM